MNRIVCLICVSCFMISAKAQTALEISTDKTTSLIFPFAIRHVDRGMRSVLAQQVKDVPTILLVKAAEKDFRETNLSVVTEDGSVYAFTVSFNTKPASWVHYLQVNKNLSVSSYANNILDNPKTINGLKDEHYNMTVLIKGIYVKDDAFYFQLGLENNSPIDYDIDLLRFYIADKKKSKRTAIQENECKPLYTSRNVEKVKANSASTIVVVLPKFTIPDAKYFAVQVTEKNGGRNLNLKLNKRKLLKAIPLN